MLFLRKISILILSFLFIMSLSGCIVLPPAEIDTPPDIFDPYENVVLLRDDSGDMVYRGEPYEIDDLVYRSHEDKFEIELL